MLTHLFSDIKKTIAGRQEQSNISEAIVAWSDSFDLVYRPQCFVEYFNGRDIALVANEIGLGACMAAAEAALLRFDDKLSVIGEIDTFTLAATCLFLDCLPLLPSDAGGYREGPSLLCASFNLATWYLGVVDRFPMHKYRGFVTCVAFDHEKQFGLNGFTKAFDSWFVNPHEIAIKDTPFSELVRFAEQYSGDDPGVIMSASRLWYAHEWRRPLLAYP